MSVNVLILGVNGFIGSALTKRILETTDWNVYGMDMYDHKLEEVRGHERFHFFEGDITINKEWIAYHIKKCDVVLPLVAIANPAVYVQRPLLVFELDFEANLEIVRQCVTHKKHLVFPSTSEVYGMSQDGAFDEENTNLVLGPIHKQRWIYSCAKQMMDRVIYAYGFEQGLRYTLFRPFNWIGPKLDNVLEPKEGSSRVLTQFISNVLHGKEIKLVGGGTQRRCFTDIDDGIDALMEILKRRNGEAQGRIFNIGNPKNDYSISELAHIILDTIKEYPAYRTKAEQTKIVNVEAEAYYGPHYQDASARVPSIENSRKYLDWTPKVSLKEALKKTLDYHLTPGHTEI